VYSNDRQDSSALFCTAVVYAELASVNSQIEVLRRQEMAAERLLDIEARRVHERVDSPEKLTRAKLLAARTQMWAVGLNSSARRLRKQLASLTGLPEREIEPVADSMPLLSELEPKASSSDSRIGQLTAARDVAQLEYVLARTRKMKTKGQTVMGTANLGDLEAAFVTEFEKLNALLEVNFELQRARLEVLTANGKLEEWAWGADANSKSGPVDVGAVQPAGIEASTPRTQGRAGLVTSPMLRSIMIAPGKAAMVAGQSQQFSAIAIYSGGKAKDATSEATWRCSSNWGAIISPSGLFTALAIGQSTIIATVGGVSQSQQITITPDDWTPLNP
jgi:hypothetical protein